MGTATSELRRKATSLWGRHGITTEFILIHPDKDELISVD